MRKPQLDEFARSLAKLTSDSNRPLVGDLDNVIFELQNTIRDTEAIIAAGGKDADAVRRCLFVLRIKLNHDLPMLFDDVAKGIDELIGPEE